MGIASWFSLTPKKPAPYVPPVAKPEQVTMHVLRTTLREDIRALSNNPIAVEILERYHDLVNNVSDDGSPVSQVEPALTFRDRINELTVGHLNRLKRRREKQANRVALKQQEKAQKETNRRRYQQSKRKPRNVQPRSSAP